MYNIKIDIGEIAQGGMDWIDLAQDRDQRRHLVSEIMNFWVPYSAGKFLCGSTTGGLSNSDQLHRVTYWGHTIVLSFNSILTNLDLAQIAKHAEKITQAIWISQQKYSTVMRGVSYKCTAASRKLIRDTRSTYSVRHKNIESRSHERGSCRCVRLIISVTTQSP
jgi:hypothetical protein